MVTVDLGVRPWCCGYWPLCYNVATIIRFATFGNDVGVGVFIS